MYRVTMHVDSEGLRRKGELTKEQFRIAVNDGTKEGAEYAAELARKQHPHQTGTGNSTDAEHLYAKKESGGGASVRFSIVNEMPYARFIEEGTTEHQIEGNPLAFQFADGRWFFGQYVNHPGNRPMPFMRPAMHRGRQIALLRIKLKTKQMLKRVWA